MPREVIVGIRPEGFEDAALGDPVKREQGGVMSVKPEVLESMGSDVFAYFPVPRPDRTQVAELERVAEEVGAGDAPGSSGMFAARLDPATQASEGTAFSLWFGTASYTCSTPRPGRRSAADPAFPRDGSTVLKRVSESD
ncbi:MAG TPA: hypothetical protein VFV73_25770 [Streptosporangiaceae bacterium]|nr:hypothetical protein [Streptosporangiaceae bacterium]